MKLLAIDTSSHACSVALRIGDAVTEDHTVEPREHTRILVPMISALLEEGGIAAADLDAIVLGNGPGSFIGMRIGASVAQGLCHGAGIKLIPVSSLAAVAAEVFAGARLLACTKPLLKLGLPCKCCRGRPAAWPSNVEPTPVAAQGGRREHQ